MHPLRTLTLAMASAATLVALTLSFPAFAQKQQVGTEAVAGAEPSPDKACSDFKTALQSTAPAAGVALTDSAGRRLSQVAAAGPLGIACARALAKHFENLRKGSGKGAWEEIEQELDKIIDTYRNLVETIEGAGGVYEEGTRALSVLSDKIEDMKKRRGESYPLVVDALKEREALASGLQRTSQLKVAVDGAIVEMQSRKSEIAEAHGIRRYTIARLALEALNDGLTQVVDELVKEMKKRPTGVSGG